MSLHQLDAAQRRVFRLLGVLPGADFDADAFEHLASWDEGNRWIDIRLRSLREQTASIEDCDMAVSFAAGEEMRTEISAKFTRRQLERTYSRVGLELLEEQLLEWPGTLLLVSHDRRLLETVALTRVLRLADGRLVEQGLQGADLDLVAVDHEGSRRFAVDDHRIGGLRVEVRGRRGVGRDPVVLGAVDRPAVAHLTVEHTRQLLAAPDRSTRTGRRDATLLATLYGYLKLDLRTGGGPQRRVAPGGPPGGVVRPGGGPRGRAPLLLPCLDWPTPSFFSPPPAGQRLIP